MEGLMAQFRYQALIALKIEVQQVQSRRGRHRWESGVGWQHQGHENSGH